MHDFLGTAVSALEGRRCLAVGSAPDFVAPSLAVDVCVPVNGAIGRTPRPALHVVHHTLLVDDTLSRRQTLERFRSQHTDVLACVGHFSADAARRLCSLDYQWNSMIIVPFGPSGDIVADACGWIDIPAGLGGITTGVFAVCLLFRLGAASVVMAGYSLTADGHYYDPDVPREQVAADTLALRHLSRHYGPRLTTTVQDLHNQCGLPLET